MKQASQHLDRFLQRRGDRWRYARRVPEAVSAFDKRAPMIRVSLKTTDLAAARVIRDALEAADNELWAALLGGHSADAALKRYAAAQKRATALGFSYRTAAELADKGTWQDLAERMEAILDERTPHVVESTVLGGENIPSVSLSKALKIWLDNIAAPKLTSKSEQQRRKWLVIPERAINTFIELVGDIPIDSITRAHAQKFYRHWLARIAPEGKARATHTASSGNRQIGELRKIYREYFAFMGMEDRPNPFAGLSFRERAKKKRPPFPTAWIKDKILKVRALENLNREARAILLVAIETGARPSEICNLAASNILLTGPVPYIRFAERSDPEDPRELKTEASTREVPLVGVALAAFKAFPEGFPRYREKEEAACATINKYLRTNKLTPSPEHTLYSLRHSFEDRMKEAGIDEEMREIFFGHRRTRQEYGSGGALKWRQSLLQRLELPFAPSII